MVIGNESLAVERGRKSSRRLDPRARLFLIPVVGIATIFVKDMLSFLLLAAGIGVVMSLSGVLKSAVKYLLVIAGICLLQMLVEGLGIPSLSVLLVTILYITERFLLFFMLGSSISKTMKTGELIGTLEKLKIPRQIVIPVAVTLRFVPTIREELGYIRESMKIRGIDSGFLAVIAHPIQSLEYFLVPLLIRSFKTADELSAAAMVKGIERKGKKCQIYDFNMNLFSIGTMGLFTIYTIFVILLGISL